MSEASSEPGNELCASSSATMIFRSAVTNPSLANRRLALDIKTGSDGGRLSRLLRAGYQGDGGNLAGFEPTFSRLAEEADFYAYRNAQSIRTLRLDRKTLL